jgi:hypothetical protein
MDSHETLEKLKNKLDKMTVPEFNAIIEEYKIEYIDFEDGMERPSTYKEIK